MKRITAVLLCLLLWGCARQAPPPIPETVPEVTAVSAMAGLYDPDHPLEKEYPGLIRAYPIPTENVHGILPLGKDLLVLSGEDKTEFTLFTGEELLEAANLTLEFPMSQSDPSLRVHQEALSYFDPLQQKTIVLDHQLQEIRQISAPEGLSGKPILSADGNTLYYCTGWSVVAWDLKSGIRRILKEQAYDTQELTGLHWTDRILECTVLQNGTNQKLFLSADQGIEIEALSTNSTLNTRNSRYFAAVSRDHQRLLIFGSADTTPELLLPKQNWQHQFYLPEDHAIVTSSASEGGIQLDYYELNTGILRSSLTLETPQSVKSIANTRDHAIYILGFDADTGCHILYRWDVLRQKPDTTNVTSYKFDYSDSENPDTEALEDCREYAQILGEKYGITVRVWEDALAVHPWDYQFKSEHLAPVLQKELELLDQRLSQYPEGMLEQTKSHFAGLTVCLVRGITGIGDDRSLSTATGIQFFQDNEAYVAITTGKYSEQALYHELYHVMETHILTESTALDSWAALNPAGFVYGESLQDADIYLKGQTRAFVDRYSMGAMKEDRARILENATLQGKKELFQSEYMQRKLNAMCTGIREAYRLKKHPEALPWEQYLVTPLVPKT